MGWYPPLQSSSRGHSYSFIYSFPRCANISFAIFMTDTALIFPSLCFWQYCLYILSAIFIVVLPISFIHYIQWRAALICCTLYPWLFEVLACNRFHMHCGINKFCITCKKLITTIELQHYVNSRANFNLNKSEILSI